MKIIGLFKFVQFVHLIFFLQKLETEEDDSYLNSQWADNQALKKSFQGLGNIKWGPR